LAPAAEGGKKKSDPTVPIIVVIVGLLLLFVFGGCGSLAVPWPSLNGSHGYNGYNGGNGGSHPTHSSHYQCGDGGCRTHHGDQYRHEHRGSGHGWRKPGPTDDPDHHGG
jgi:hypothetical protein